jgi:hypothetical protein
VPLVPPDVPVPVEVPVEPEVEVEPPEEDVTPLPQARVKRRSVIGNEADGMKWQRWFTGSSAGNGAAFC